MVCKCLEQWCVKLNSRRAGDLQSFVPTLLQHPYHVVTHSNVFILTHTLFDMTGLLSLQ